MLEFRGAVSLGFTSYCEFNRVVRCTDQILLGAEIPLRGLDRGVAEKQLDLFKLSAGRSAEFGTSAPQVMRRDARNTHCLGISLKHLPYDLLAQPFSPTRSVRFTRRKTWPSIP